MGYNGWKNKNTWNVSLWINNDEGLYRMAVDHVKKRGHLFGAYKSFVRETGLDSQATPDGADYYSEDLDWKALDEMMLELVTWESYK